MCVIGFGLARGHPMIYRWIYMYICIDLSVYMWVICDFVKRNYTICVERYTRGLTRRYEPEFCTIGNMQMYVCVYLCASVHMYMYVYIFVSYLIRLMMMQVVGNQPRCQYENCDNQSMTNCVLTARYLLNGCWLLACWKWLRGEGGSKINKCRIDAWNVYGKQWTSNQNWLCVLGTNECRIIWIVSFF